MEGNPHDQQNPYPQRNQMGAIRSRSAAPVAGPVFDAHGREAERMARDLEHVRQADLFDQLPPSVPDRRLPTKDEVEQWVSELPF